MTDAVEAARQLKERGSLAMWVHGARLYSLVVTLAPILVGAGYALGETGGLALWPVAAATISGLAIQIATNLANDAADGTSGVDSLERPGPPRLTGSGLLTASEVRAGALVMTGVAALFGLFAVIEGGWPILAIGLASILAGWAYSFGPRPISGTAWGEVFVIVFFGVLAVAGIAWLGARLHGATPLLLGLAIGMPAGAVLTVNNHRDRVQDFRSGRRTLAIRIGPKATLWLYGAQMVGASLIAALAILPLSTTGAALIAATAAGGLWMTVRVARTPISLEQSQRLAETAQFQMVLALLLALVLVVRP